MPYQKPLELFREKGITDEVMHYVKNGVKKVLDVAGVKTPNIYDHGLWEKGKLQHHIERARFGREIDSDQLIATFSTDSVTTRLNPVAHEQHHHLVVLYSKIYAPKGVLYYGMAGDITALVSLGDLINLGDERVVGSCIEVLASHEYGHLLGLVPATRRTNVHGFHCTNPSCIMRQESKLVEDARRQIHAGRAFCSECEGYLKSLRLS